MAADEIYFRLHHTQQVGLYDLKALIQIDSTQNRFKSISQDGGALASSAQLLALAKLQVVTQMNLFGIFIQGAFANKVSTQLSELAFSQIRKVLIHVGAHDNAEHGITQKLNPLIMMRFRILLSFMGIRCMGQSHIKKL